MSKYDVRIDGDVLIYRAGFAADSSSKELSHSLSNIKFILSHLKERFPGDRKIYLSSLKQEVNFRYSIYPEYKGNRVSKCKFGCASELIDLIDIQQEGDRFFRAKQCKECDAIIKGTKPVHFYNIRSYLKEKCGAKVVKWGECDDWLGVDLKENSVIASIDKDLLMIPTLHYRMHTGEIILSSDPGEIYLTKKNKVKVLEGFGFKWFCAQMLSGDKVDNIKSPLSSGGHVKIYNMLAGATTPKEAWEVVLRTYESQEDIELLEKNGKLLWIAREPKQEFSFELIEEIINGT